jgi:hypothetical protein
MTMQWMVDDLMKGNSHPGRIKRITQDQYQQWQRGFVFEALRHQRYGQSFCNHFDIQDNILYYASTMADADRYIRETYIE